MRIIPAASRHFEDYGWLQTYWLFSFSDYYDPENIQHGDLRVFNDDRVAPDAGFPAHPHQDMEIITIVWDGALTHEDSTGGRGTIGAGEVQAMTAGKGIQHSEFNAGRETTHLYQIWIRPNREGLEPGYDQRRFDAGDWQNRMAPVASGLRSDVLNIHADATVYICRLDAGRLLEYPVVSDGKAFLYIKEGELSLGGQILRANDQARLVNPGMLRIEARKDTTFVAIELVR